MNVSGTGTNTNYYFQKTVACVVCFTIFGAPGSVANINITVYNYIFRCIFDLGVFLAVYNYLFRCIFDLGVFSVPTFFVLVFLGVFVFV